MKFRCLPSSQTSGRMDNTVVSIKCMMWKVCRSPTLCRYLQTIIYFKWHEQGFRPLRRWGLCRFVWKSQREQLKGTVSRDFCLWFFLWISYPPAPEYPIRTVSNFFQNSRRYSQLEVYHRCRWHRWQMKKIFNQKNFNNFVMTPFDSRVNIYINFCLQVHFKVSSAWY